MYSVQAMKRKQSALLTRLDGLDEECETLKEELVQVENGRKKLACDLKLIQVQYQEVQEQLTTEQVSIRIVSPL